jgi:hypothetical protein
MGFGEIQQRIRRDVHDPEDNPLITGAEKSLIKEAGKPIPNGNPSP